MSDAPETIEYVVEPITSNPSQIGIEVKGDPYIVDVSVTDLAKGLTVIGVPAGVPLEQIDALGEHIRKSAQLQDAGQFIVVHGDIGTWQFVRLVRKDVWDADRDGRA